ncbi:hypothetical protein [Micromonospora sp. LOL_024]|uniref:hypothetical protein n=1 Tax=Micromonospora sp. LOL_024 TaxID=3345412 RepID=UPI003A8A846F
MQSWDPLKEHQLLVLRRIGDGDDLSGPDGVDQRHMARALQTRRLVGISRRGGVWRAQITDAGRFYLDNGIHPDHPDRISGDSKAPRQRVRTPATAKQGKPATALSGAGDATKVVGSTPSPAAATVEQARQLVERLQAEGGTVRVESSDTEERARYRRVIQPPSSTASYPPDSTSSTLAALPGSDHPPVQRQRPRRDGLESDPTHHPSRHHRS